MSEPSFTDAEAAERLAARRAREIAMAVDEGNYNRAKMLGHETAFEFLHRMTLPEER